MNLESELKRLFGFDAFRPGQKALVDAMVHGRDALGVMPTGGGKSLCFQLPAAELDGTAIVVSPLIALMKDQVDALSVRGIKAAALNSMLTASERRDVFGRFMRGELKLLYIAPERIQAEGFMDALAKVPVSFIAIDEAHCISHWGHDFRPDYRRLSRLRAIARNRAGQPVAFIALTATATQRVQGDIVERLEMKDPIRVITGFRRVNLGFEVRSCSGRADKFRILDEGIRRAIEEGGSTVIYAATRKHVELVAEHLSKSTAYGRVAGFYHAGMADENRTKAQQDFLEDRIRVLVATNAFGMGIDKPNVRLVAHFDIPGSVEAYYQEAGRAGRDGKPARCVLLFNHADVGTQEFFIEKTTGEQDQDAAQERMESQKALLRQLVRYAYSTECRQRLVLGYFGDPEADTFEGCGNCDRCRPSEAQAIEISETLALACRKALSAVARMNGRFGKSRVSEVLKGSETAGVIQMGLQHQSTYGLLRDWSLAGIRELIDLLAEAGYLRVTGLEFPVLGISAQGLQALKGQASIQLARLPESAPRAERAKRRAPDAPESSESMPVNTGVLEALKAFRREQAREKSVPAYVIFHDRTLEELAAREPGSMKSVSDLAGIPGLGEKKLALYGEKVIQVISGVNP